MYEKLNMTENHLQVLILFTKGYNKDYYIREVERTLKIGLGTAQTVLDDLEKKGVLESQEKGKVRLYRLRNNQTATEFMILTEQYKKVTFMQKNLVARELIGSIFGYTQGIAVIFGSYAKGTQREGSDMDILIAGNHEKKELSKAAKMLDLEVNVKYYPLDVFIKELKTDLLLKEVLENHITIAGSEGFVRAAMR